MEDAFNEFRWPSNMVKISKYEYLTASDNTYDSNAKGIYKCNVLTNKWQLFIQYPLGLKITFHSICYNKESKMLYIFGSETQLIAVNIETKIFEIHDVTDMGIGQCAVLIIIDNKCNIIGGSDSTQHLIWNDESKQFESKWTFSHLSAGIMGHGIVHIKSKNVLLLFGGNDYSSSKSYDTFWKYDLNTNKKQWIEMKDIKLPVPMYDFGYVLTLDESFLLLFVGDIDAPLRENDDFAHFEKSILVLDINENIWYKSAIQSPEKYKCDALLVLKDCNILISGFVKSMADKYNMNIPNELIGILQMYYNEESVYLLYEGYDDCHYQMLLMDIFTDMSVIHKN